MMSEITADGITILRPAPRKWLTNGDAWTGDYLCLGAKDSEANWREVDEEPQPPADTDPESVIAELEGLLT